MEILPKDSAPAPEGWDKGTRTGNVSGDESSIDYMNYIWSEGKHEAADKEKYSSLDNRDKHGSALVQALK